MYGIHQNLKKKTDQKVMFNPGKSTFGATQKIEGWKMESQGLEMMIAS